MSSPLKERQTRNLGWCSKCKEKSTIVKVYEVLPQYGETHELTGVTKSGRKRVEFCLNKGCGYRLELPFHSTTTYSSQ